MWTRLVLRTLRQAILVPAIAVIFAMTMSVGAQTKTLRLASTAWSPFTNVPGKARFALDLVHTALERIGITAETIIIDEGNLTPALINFEFQGSAALWRDEAREKALIYSQPYLQNRLILVGLRGSDVSAKTLSDLKGKRLALVQGYAYGEMVKGPNAPTYVPSLSEEDSLQKLLNGAADDTLMDELVVEYLLKNHSAEARSRLAFGSVPLILRTLHLAIHRNVPDAQAIIDKFNAELKKMIADRSYHRLLQLDWIEADVDGDGRLEYVPKNDQAGPNAPDHSYKLFMDRLEADSVTAPKGFYFGGKVYPTWSSVPDAHKAPPPPGGSSSGSQFSIFTFKW
jgi:polar amino acid transport system substrate-binding protein